jgi:putative membrane protein
MSMTPTTASSRPAADGKATGTPAEHARLVAAVRAVEAVSRAEVVVRIVPRSAHHDRGPLLAGAGVAAIALWLLLFTPWEFSLATIAVVPPLTGCAVALLVAAVPAWERAVTPRARRRGAVERAARSAFVEQRVGHTRERSGILIYVSRREREIAAVPDKGIVDCVPPDAWAQIVGVLEVAGREGSDESLAAAVQAMADVLGRELPRRAEDIDELPDVTEELK